MARRGRVGSDGDDAVHAAFRAVATYLVESKRTVYALVASFVDALWDALTVAVPRGTRTETLLVLQVWCHPLPPHTHTHAGPHHRVPAPPWRRPSRSNGHDGVGDGLGALAGMAPDGRRAAGEPRGPPQERTRRRPDGRDRVGASAAARGGTRCAWRPVEKRGQGQGGTRSAPCSCLPWAHEPPRCVCGLRPP